MRRELPLAVGPADMAFQFDLSREHLAVIMLLGVRGPMPDKNVLEFIRFNRLCPSKSRAVLLLKELCRTGYIESGFGAQFWHPKSPAPVQRWYLSDLGYSVYEHYRRLDSAGFWALSRLFDKARLSHGAG